MRMTKSKALYQKYKHVVLEVTPFRKPILASAKDNFYTDVDGNTYLDLMAGQFCEVLGHSNEELRNAINKQLTKITHTNTLCLTEELFEACLALSEVTAPSLNKSILLSTGAEAVECALRYAKFYTKRTGIVSFQDGYHGLTLATQSSSSGGQYAQPKVQDTYFIPTPDIHHLPPDTSSEAHVAACLRETKTLLAPYKGSIAAFILEPVVSVGGMIYPPKSYFKGLQEIIKEHEALLIFDECQTGLGRLGSWFGYEQTGVVPDILVLAKAAGLGLAVSAVVFSDEIAAAVEGNYIHFSSHQNDPLSACTMLFLLKTIHQHRLLDRITDVGTYFLQKLQELSDSEPWIENPRGIGLMIGFDLPEEEFTSTKNPGMKLIDYLEEDGVMVQAIRRGKTFRLIPSYVISKSEIDLFIQKLKKGVGRIKHAK